MEPIPFRSLLMTEGVLSRDGRMMAPGSQVWTCPLTLYAQTTDGHGGEAGPTEIVGRIDQITRLGDELWGDGFLTTDCGIYVIAPMIADLTLRGISVDTAPKIVEYRVGPGEAASGVGIAPDEAPVQQTPEEAANPQPEISEGEPVHRESVEDVIMVVIEGEIIAATICGKQAMGDAYIELVTAADPAAPDLPAATPEAEPIVAAGGLVWRTHGTLVAATPPPPPESAPDAPSAPESDAEPTEQPDYSGSAMICLYPPEASPLAVDGGTPSDELHVTLMYLGDAADLGDPTELQSICSELAAQLEPGSGRIAGPAAFVNDPDPDQAESEIPLVALIDSDWVCDLYAALDDALDASGIDSPTEHGFIPHMTLAYAAAPSLLTIAQTDLSFPSIWLVIGDQKQEYPCGAALTASALGAAPDEPPADWFLDPKFDGPHALTVTDDGQVFGHIATWGTCHQGIQGRCVRAPKSRSGYAYFHLGEIRSSEGNRIPVGQVTIDTRHADLAATRKQASMHYDHTGHAVADVRAGEDKHGIWIAGAVRPETPSSALRAFRGCKISGDWRSVNGGLELVGALGVNIPGFPVPRTQARSLAASGEVTALIAAELDLEYGISEEQTLDALAFMAEHGEHAIDVLVASAHEPVDGDAYRAQLDALTASLEA